MLFDGGVIRLNYLRKMNTKMLCCGHA